MSWLSCCCRFNATELVDLAIALAEHVGDPIARRGAIGRLRCAPYPLAPWAALSPPSPPPATSAAVATVGAAATCERLSATP